MKHHRTPRRLLAGMGAALTAAAVAATGAPAHAAAPDLSLYLSDVTIAAGSAGVTSDLAIFASEPTITDDLTVTVDTAGVTGVADIALQEDWNSDPFDCVTSGTVSTCTLSEAWAPVTIDEYGLWLFNLTISPADGAAVDASGSLKITTGAAGKTAATSVKVTIGEGVNLATTNDDVTFTGTPGQTVPVDLGVRNVGEKTTDGVVLYFSSDGDTVRPADYRNCAYSASSGEAFCEFDTALRPGSAYRLEGFQAAISKTTLAPSKQYGYHTWMTPAEWADTRTWFDRSGTTFTPGTGPALALDEVVSAAGAQTDTDPSDNGGGLEVTVTGDNPADLAAIGAEFAGEVGAEIATTVGFRNNGPATLDYNNAGDAASVVRIEVPDGTTVTKVGEYCLDVDGDNDGDETGGREYLCYMLDLLAAGEEATFDFTFRIDTKTTNALGTVRVNPEEIFGDRNDGNTENDLAYIVVNGDGTVPGPGDGDGGQGGGDGDGDLPLTGAQTGLIAGVGAALLAAGAIGFVVARRRRTTFVA